MRRFRVGLFALVLVLGSAALAAPPKGSTLEDKSLEELKAMDLESLLELTVSSSTKTEQRSGQAPAVVTVVTAEEIAGRGYTSLAEVLRAVPGFYDVYDLVFHNVGIRGVNGGARASGNVLKLMIDGHPVDYRPTTGNFFGEELIPLTLVERVEIIRGPASALYGANAFLGVVNLITKKGSELAGASLLGQLSTIHGKAGWGGGMVLGQTEENLDILAGVSVLRLNRSGLALPLTSPVLADPTNGIRSSGGSRDDIARPASVFGKFSLGDPSSGKLSIMASIQRLDSVGEFQDFGPLSHDTRIALLNQNYRIGYQLDPSDKVSLELTGHYLNGAPLSSERLGLGRQDFVLVRSSDVNGFGFALESKLQLHKMLTVTLGADWVREDHLLQTFDQVLTQDVLTQDGTVLRRAGTIIPGENHGQRRKFDNVGALGQAILKFGEDWSAVGGARLDWHNIYGTNPSFRAGIVFAPPNRPLSLKALYGSSFKAPSAVQLFTQPLGTLDILGNPALKPQTAHTVELAGGFGLKDLGELALNVYLTNVRDLVEFTQRGYFLVAQNTGEIWVGGGELDARMKLTRELSVRGSAGVATTLSHSSGQIFTGAPETDGPLFPVYQVHLSADYLLPLWKLRLSGEVSIIGSRPSSQSNSLVKTEAYDLPGYVYTALAVTTRGYKWLGERETQFSFRVTDVLHQRWTEPGFGGVDVPTQGLSARLLIMQGL